MCGALQASSVSSNPVLCLAPGKTQRFWKVSRKKIEKREKSLKELTLFGVTKRKLLCNLTDFQRVSSFPWQLNLLIC